MRRSLAARERVMVGLEVTLLLSGKSGPANEFAGYREQSPPARTPPHAHYPHYGSRTAGTLLCVAREFIRRAECANTPFTREEDL